MKEVIEHDAFQYFVSACVVRQPRLPHELITYHEAVLRENGFNVDKVREMPDRMFKSLTPSLRIAGYGRR